MPEPIDTPQHYVAYAVYSLTAAVIEISNILKDPELKDLLDKEAASITGSSVILADIVRALTKVQVS